MNTKQLIVDLIEKETKLKKQEIKNLLEIPPKPELGDYSLPCFILAKKLKKSPEQIASEISKKLKKRTRDLEEIENVESFKGYVNFLINLKILVQEIFDKIDNHKTDKKKHKIIIDFSSPNVGKPMHIGHIRSTILGDSLLRILDFQGYNVKGINYLGDIGLHIGKLIVAYELWLNKQKLKQNPVKELLRLYVKFNEKEGTQYKEGLEEEFQENEWTQKAKEKLELLEKGDKKAHKIWQEIQKYSKKGFNEVYKILNVNFHKTTGQSLFSEKGKKIIIENLKKGKAKTQQDNAVFVDLKEFNLPKKYVLRKNGTASYITQDIGAAVERYKNYKFDKMIYVTDFRQEIHFKQLFKILEKFNYGFSDKLFHIGFGTVNFGKQIMKTRKGKIILLKDVLNKTIEKAKKEIKKRKTSGNAKKVGTGALKYSFLKNIPEKDVNFSYEEALNFEGNTGPYLQYSYARASSILRKSKKTAKYNPGKIIEMEKQEIKLIKKFDEFPEIINKAEQFLNPSLISNYCFELASNFNEFYSFCPVINSEKEEFRLKIVQEFRKILSKCLYLLGIEVMERM